MTFKTTISSLLCLGFVALAACTNQSFGLPPAQQQFAQDITYNPRVDFLLVIDNSSSMAQYQDQFASQVPAMIAKLNQMGLDYHIGVTTTDMKPGGTGGKLQGATPYLTQSSPNLVATLKSRIQQGQNGSDLERGIESAYTVMQPSYLNGAGKGFLRDDSMLAMVFLSNEDDYSLESWQYYKSYFDKVRPMYKLNQRSWIANFIGVISIDQECQTRPDLKEAGLKYMSLVDASGGRKESICKSDFATAISNIHARIAELITDYYLARKPKVDTIRVTVNGHVVPNDSTNGWTYDATGNFVRFHGTAIPGATDQIFVDFQPIEAT